MRVRRLAGCDVEQCDRDVVGGTGGDRGLPQFEGRPPAIVIAQHCRDSRVADGVSEAVAADQVTSSVAQGLGDEVRPDGGDFPAAA